MSGRDVWVATGGRPAGHRAVPLLAEPALDHYPEYAGFLATVFGLDADPFGPPGVLTVGGRPYELTFLGRSGRPFPCGVELAALVPGLEPLDTEVADRDVWAILEWVTAGVGVPWSVEALRTTGRIYRVPAAED